METFYMMICSWGVSDYYASDYSMFLCQKIEKLMTIPSVLKFRNDVGLND